MGTLNEMVKSITNTFIFFLTSFLNYFISKNKLKVDIVRRMKYPRNRYLVQNSPPTEEEYELSLESADLCWKAFLRYNDNQDWVKFLKHNFEMFYELSSRRTSLKDFSKDPFKVVIVNFKLYTIKLGLKSLILLKSNLK